MWKKQKYGSVAADQVSVETEIEKPKVEVIVDGEGNEEVIVEALPVASKDEPVDVTRANLDEIQKRHDLGLAQLQKKRIVKTRLERVNALPINKRYGAMETLFRAVLRGIIPATMIQSGPGIGKTHMLLEILKELGAKENIDYVIIKAGTSAFGIYKIVCHWAEIAQQRDEDAKKKDGKSQVKKPRAIVPTIILDDVFIPKTGPVVEVCKGLMDTYKVRQISWNTDRAEIDPEVAKEKGKLPAKVMFSGGVIILTNQKLKEIDKPMQDRAAFIPIQVTDAEMVERIKTIASSSKFQPDVNPKLKMQVVNWLCSNEYEGDERSMRTLVKALGLAQADPKNWREIVQII